MTTVNETVQITRCIGLKGVSGSVYNGYVQVSEIRFDYELIFNIPIETLDTLKNIDNAQELRKIFNLTLWREGKKIELTDRNYLAFCVMLVDFAQKFFKRIVSEISRVSPEGEMYMESKEVYEVPKPFLKMVESLH